MAIRFGLIAEVIAMAFDTVRGNKLRSGLTVLGVVIGITSIVGMTSLIRGFDESIRDLMRQIGPDTIFVYRFAFAGFSNATEVKELLKRPNLTVSDMRALEDQATSVQFVDIQLGAGATFQRVFYRDQKTKPIIVFGTTENFAQGTRIPFRAGRYFNPPEVQFHANVVVLGYTAFKKLFEDTGLDPIGKTVRVGSQRFTIIGAFDKRVSTGAFGSNADDFVVIPYTTYEGIYGLKPVRALRTGLTMPIQIAVVPGGGVSRDEAMADVERVMRIRHGLKLDQPDDFDMVTQDSILKLWDNISQATFFALVVISSIALMVGGIGVMAIMSISVTERTREIGVRKALGARRAEILFQFLMEAAFLTSLGGLLGVLLGSGIGVAVHLVSGFPISLPWWSFALGLGFSASVGIFFGMYPAFKASRLDPIDALRYE